MKQSGICLNKKTSATTTVVRMSVYPLNGNIKFLLIQGENYLLDLEKQFWVQNF